MARIKYACNSIQLIITKKTFVQGMSLPCPKLNRRLVEFLTQGLFPSTSYDFIIDECGEIPKDAILFRAEAKSIANSTIQFEVKLVLDSGEYYKGTLRAAIKYDGHGLVQKIATAVEKVNTNGWHHTPVVLKNKKGAVHTQPSPEVLFVRKIDALTQSMATEVKGMERDITKMKRDIQDKRAKIRELRKAAAQLEAKKSLLLN